MVWLHFFLLAATRPAGLFAAEMDLVIVAPRMSCFLSFTFASELA